MNIRNPWLVAPLAAGLATALLSGCGTGDSAEEAGTGEPVVMGMSDEVAATDPASGYDPGSWLLFNNVFQSLLSFPKGETEPQPEAAKKCGFSDAESKTYKCTLRDGLKFSNGHELTSKDVAYSFERTLKIDDPDGPAVMLSTIDTIDTPDDKTVVFNLNTSDATFPSKIASGAGSIVDSREYPANKLRGDSKAIGSGPYKLDSYGKKEAVFSVNPGYKGTAEVQNSGMTLKFFHGDGGQDKLQKSLAAGKIDLAYRGLSADAIAKLQADADTELEVVEGTSAEAMHLVFNMKDPIAGQEGVRKAFAYLLDREALVKDVYQDTASPLYSMVPAQITGHNTSFFDRYGARPDRAKAAAALRADGITDKVKLTLWSTPDRYGPATDAMFEAIAGQLNDSGLFEADVKSVEESKYAEDISAGKYGVYAKGWVPDYPDPDNFTQPFFGPDNVLENGYENSEITKKIIPGAAAEAERATTSDKFGDLQDIVADDVPILPVWQGKQYAVAGAGVTGLEWCLDESTVFRFWEIAKS